MGNCMASRKFSSLKINLAIGFTRKISNDAIPWLNEATSQIFQSTANFEKSQNSHVFCLPS